MNRLLLLIVMLLGCISSATADHITGGEVFYRYTGTSGNGMNEYDVTIRIFMRCNSGRQFNNPAAIAIFHKNTSVKLSDYSVFLSRRETLSERSSDPCINNPPLVCYEVGYYEFHIAVPASGSYIIASHVMFRIDGINNLINGYNQVGATYVGEIPAVENNSAHFIGNDLVTVCANNSFTYSFAAEDADGDQLRYSFCDAYRTSGAGGFGDRTMPPPPPPYESVPYGQGFTGSSPLGRNVKIDPETGLITGIAPDIGVYVVTVCVEELRNGFVIATQHKDLQINITSCSVTGATLPDEYMLCGSTTTLMPANISNSPNINSYKWEFTTLSGTVLFSSSSPEPVYTFADTGLYRVKLVVNDQEACSDSAVSIARVYPGFVPDFDVAKPCIIRATEFTDASTSVLGTVNAWSWDFGEPGPDNSSLVPDPLYQFSSIGTKNVTLIVENTMGCRDTITKTVTIYDKPPVNLAFRDTLICPPDNLQLIASGNGTYTWSPAAAFSNPDVPDPFVSPVTTTTYYVDLMDDGCANRDSVTVRVVNSVSLQLPDDMKSCEGDPVQLTTTTNALRFSWSPASTLNDATLKEPLAVPQGTTTYQLTAYISTCSATESITVTPIPYPVANAGPDTVICYNTPAQLQASTNGSSYVWAPLVTLQNGGSLNPVATPLSSTTYALYAFDTLGCDKPGIDSVHVMVQPEIVPFAGRDTSVVINQPLKMQASGGSTFQWIPATGLSANDIADPIAQYNASPAEGYYTYKVLVSNATGCVDSAQVRVSVYSTLPEIYVPTAFTPNGDGHNDHFRLVAPGIEHVNVFRVYNRWGQIVYDSPITHSLGWDGSYNGKPLASDTFVWIVHAVDYTGKNHFKKGTVTLIR